jgi:predicted HD phosphohydrolase
MTSQVVAASAGGADGRCSEMSDKVSFTAMADGTAADYALTARHDDALVAATAGNVLTWLQALDGDSPYQISRLGHSLQTATRAERDGADDETVVCALLHDIGDLLAPANHSQVAAALLRPYVSEKNHWIVEHHGLFQGYYYFHHFGQDRNARDRFRDHRWYQDCVDFCARWDQVSFDPGYDTLPLAHFAPRVEALFAKEPASFV